MNVRYCVILLLAAFAVMACSHISEDEQLIYVKPSSAQRAVLLEDFTGQRCINCPKGTEVIEQLTETYGDSAVIAVGIHSGPLGFAGNAQIKGLATSVGDEYYAHWQLEYQPVGLVNRHGAVNYSEWMRAVQEELSQVSPLDMSVDVALRSDDTYIDIVVSVFGTDGTVSGKLQVWLVEDSIEAMQLMPDGSANRTYIHNHVLRTTVNGTWGEDVTINEAERQQYTMSLPLDTAWNPKHLAAVAFVYNDQGVLQATRGEAQ